MRKLIIIGQVLNKVLIDWSGPKLKWADPGFFLGRVAPLRNDVADW